MDLIMVKLAPGYVQASCGIFKTSFHHEAHKAHDVFCKKTLRVLRELRGWIKRSILK